LRLPESVQVFRHQKIVWFLLGLALAVGVLAVLQGQPTGHALTATAIPAAIATVGWKCPLPYRARSAIAAAGLMVTAIMAVQITGSTEAHFLFFILVPVVALYEDWAPLAAAVGTVITAHIVWAVLATQQLAGSGAPWGVTSQTALHVGLFLAACATSVVHWTIQERARAEERVLLERFAELAQRDPLTGLANRALLQERLLHASSTEEPILVLAVDIDGFKPINDSYGHAAGDALLIEIARRLESCIRAGDTAARTGGDEFTLVLPRSGRHRGMAIAQGILEAVAEPIAIAGTHLRVTASVGITVDSSRTDPRILLEQADAAMYAAKFSGRAAYAFFSAAPAAKADGPLFVDPENARAWAAYTRNLRGEIAKAKELGTLPPQTRGPESTRRTLESVLAAIDTLPLASTAVALALPEATALEEFVFHHDLVQKWAATLVLREILQQEMPDDAARFWSQLRQAVINGRQAPNRTLNPAQAQDGLHS
jgi:diguanylate cyclase (GGDEF)-like protein